MLIQSLSLWLPPALSSRIGSVPKRVYEKHSTRSHARMQHAGSSELCVGIKSLSTWLPSRGHFQQVSSNRERVSECKMFVYAPYYSHFAVLCAFVLSISLSFFSSAGPIFPIKAIEIRSDSPHWNLFENYISACLYFHEPYRINKWRRVYCVFVYAARDAYGRWKSIQWRASAWRGFLRAILPKDKFSRDGSSPLESLYLVCVCFF